MKLNHIIYNIKNLISKGLQLDDVDLSDRQLAHIINYYRARLIKQEHEKGKVDNGSYIQNLGEVELIMADRNGLCDIHECALRTKEKIPKFLETSKGMNVVYVGTMDGSTSFQRELIASLPWSKANKYTGNQPTWWYQDEYIFIDCPPTPNIKYINVQGVFENPLEAEEFRGYCAKQPCDELYDMEYPLPEYYVDVIVKMMFQSELNVYLRTPEDTLNNTQDAPTNPPIQNSERE